MIILLGATGYVGTAFTKLLESKKIKHKSISRTEIDYYKRTELSKAIKSLNADFLINAAGFTGKPNVDACEHQKTETLLGNSVLPGIIREVCEDNNLPWGHVSSGCIYSGRRQDGNGFNERDVPNFSFRTNNSSFYSGTKALGEETLEGTKNCYIWRLRIPFNHEDSPRNFLSKLLRYKCLLNAENSVSHLDEYVSACLASWQKEITPGIYNVTNTGSLTTREVVALIRKHLTPDREFKFFSSEEDFMKTAAKTPRSNCVMDNSKLRKAGVQISDVDEAIVKSLQNWSWEIN